MGMDEIVSEASRKVGYRSPARYRKRCEFLFDGIDLRGKRVLDVGCGSGALAIWAALEEASWVLGIEPEADGSTGGSLDQFRRAVVDLDLGSTVESKACVLQDLAASEDGFDVVALYQVINHLDEEAVVELHRSVEAMSKYVTALRHLRELTRRDGVVIVSDCDRRNMWNDIGLHNPLMPTIEWEKHQPPTVWVEVFKRAGFVLKDLRWSHIYPFGRMSDNKLLHYMTFSHFTLRFVAV